MWAILTWEVLLYINIKLLIDKEVPNESRNQR
jgi:hypothetical protein